MPLQLNKILTDIAGEKALHPNNHNVSAVEVEDAWSRVSKSNKLSVHETRSIFKVLQKKYEQEKQKAISSWKLFEVMNNMHRKEDADQVTEEDEEFEMLEVQEDDDNIVNEVGSDGDSSAKSSSSSTTTPEKPERLVIPEKYQKLITTRPAAKAGVPSTFAITPTTTPLAAGVTDEKKLLNSMVNLQGKRNSTNQQQSVPPATTQVQSQSKAGIKTTTLLQHKGITLKRTQVNPKVNMPNYFAMDKKETTTLQLPESIKRKLNEDLSAAHLPKKVAKNQVENINSATISNVNTNSNHTTITNINNNNKNHTNNKPIIVTESSMENIEQPAVIKEEPSEFEPGTVITIPPPNNGVGVAMTSVEATAPSSSSNGYPARIEEIDFSRDIIFDGGGPSAINGGNNNTDKTTDGGEFINMGNFDNTLPPTFFKNLCNSSRHEAFGLYVANTMNRMSKSAANKLEVHILRAVADIMCEDNN